MHNGNPLDLLGKHVAARIFGQTLIGTLVRYFHDPVYNDGTVWARVVFRRPVIVGGVGPAQSFVDVSPRVIELADPQSLLAPAARLLLPDADEEGQDS